MSSWRTSSPFSLTMSMSLVLNSTNSQWCDLSNFLAGWICMSRSAKQDLKSRCPMHTREWFLKSPVADFPPQSAQFANAHLPTFPSLESMPQMMQLMHELHRCLKVGIVNVSCCDVKSIEGSISQCHIDIVHTHTWLQCHWSTSTEKSIQSNESMDLIAPHRLKPTFHTLNNKASAAMKQAIMDQHVKHHHSIARLAPIAVMGHTIRVHMHVSPQNFHSQVDCIHNSPPIVTCARNATMMPH